MDTKQLLKDEELTGVTGGNQAIWISAVNSDFIPRLEKIAACASDADKAVLQGYIDTLRSTCSSDFQSAHYAVNEMFFRPGPIQDEAIRGKVNYLLLMIYEGSKSFLPW